MEYGTIERDIHVEASPEIVYEVISRPEHVSRWWPDEARFEPVPGAAGELVWRDEATGETKAVDMTVVETDPPRRFSFRWCYAGDGPALLVTFELTPAGAGTTIRMTETGFREMGWEVAVLEETYRDHVSGWDHYVPALGAYVTRLVTSS
jgi:uncharacterized protein YndB with AHSA1/START domain